MEKNIRINWQLIVSEAKKRRKENKITQAQLAAAAKLSTPTISDFENGNMNVLVSSVINILSSLNMVDNTNLEFYERFVEDNAARVIIFFAQDNNKRIEFKISYEVLEDFFENSSNYSRTFSQNKDSIEHIAFKKYLNSREEKILITTKDFI